MTVHTGTKRDLNRREFGEHMLTLGLASLFLTMSAACGDSPTEPTSTPKGNSPQPPSNPVPPTEPLDSGYPFGIRFVDGSEATRIGDMRKSKNWGTLRDAIEGLKIPFETRGTNRGNLVTMFDSVRPGSAYGIVFLVQKTRMTDKVDDLRVAPDDTFAGYEWKGGMPNPTDGYVIIT